MTSEEKIVKIKEIFRNTVGKNYSRTSREEIEKEILQFTIADIIDELAEIDKMIHDIYDVVED